MAFPSRSRCLRLRDSSRAVSRPARLILQGGVSPSFRLLVALSWPLVVEGWGVCVHGMLLLGMAHDIVVAQGWAPLRTMSSRMCLGQI